MLPDVTDSPDQSPMTAPSFNPHRQCCWCGSDNRKGAVGYAGERACPTCGWGGDGAPDVPCMFYKIVKTAA